MSEPLIAESRLASRADITRVAVRLALLNADELEALEMLLDKLLAGKAKHGPLDLDTDTRDWLAEMSAEAFDKAFYAAFALIQRKRGLL